LRTGGRLGAFEQTLSRGAKGGGIKPLLQGAAIKLVSSEGQQKLLGDLNRALRELRAQDQLRSLAQVTGVNFCSNDYLGLAEEPRLREATLDAVARSSELPNLVCLQKPFRPVELIRAIETARASQMGAIGIAV